jgi:hypothetical protein
MPNDKTISPVAAGLQKEQHAIQQPMLGEFNLNQHASTFNDGTKVKQLIHEEYNTGRNIGRLLELIESGGARDISFEKKVDNTPFFLVSSGPSFDKNIHHLRDWHGGIFCSTSHALTLMYHGIEPTHIIALDPFCEWKELEGVDWSKTRTKLCLQPGVKTGRMIFCCSGRIAHRLIPFMQRLNCICSQSALAHDRNGLLMCSFLRA